MPNETTVRNILSFYDISFLKNNKHLKSRIHKNFNFNQLFEGKIHGQPCIQFS